MNYLGRMKGMNGKIHINEGEKIIEEQLKDELQLHIIGVNNCCNLISKAIEVTPEMNIDSVPSSLKVVTSLLAKVINDLRSAAILSSKGYSIQSATLISSLYEAAFMITFIGNDDQLAEKWIGHNDPKRLFINVYDLTENGLKNINAPNYKDLANSEYQKYRQLCMVKHGNPLIQKGHVFEIEGNTIVASFGPEISEQSIRVSWFALENAINYSMIALSSYINCHLMSNTTEEVIRLFQDLKELYKVLNTKAVERWANEET